MRDVHLVEIFRQLHLNQQTELHYMFHIEEFLRLKNPNSDWKFRVREDGMFVLTQASSTGSTKRRDEQLQSILTCRRLKTTCPQSSNRNHFQSPQLSQQS